MADFENIANIRGVTLADLEQHVLDVRAISLAAEDEYQVGTLALSSFDFVPYALSGLSAAMQTPAGSDVRPTTTVAVPLADDIGGTAIVTRQVTVYGPGDVAGIDAGQIVRRYPAPGSTTAEETFHAHIEFDRPEVPWAFSAQTPGDRMRAWLALVVLERDELTWEPAGTALHRVMRVDASVLPPLSQAWAWAHAQATAGTASLGARLSTAWAPVNVSRLLAARILTQNTNYVACLVPTTEVGVRAALGVGGGGLGLAWTTNSGEVRLPVFDHWEFRTAPDGDFARLARRLQHMAAPWAIGRRIMDASQPGEPLDALGANDAGRRQVIRCALYSPSPRPPDQLPDDAAWSAPRTAALRSALERPAVIEGAAGTDPGAIPDLPIVGPRIYAKAQRAAATIAPGDWFAELNLSPVNRVVAGLGTRVVAKDQEQLMQAAWSQVGEVERANRALALAELARNLANRIHVRLAMVDPGRLLQITAPASPRLKLDGAGLTVSGQTLRSALAPAATSGAFRRALRSTGPVLRRLDPAERAPLTRLVADRRGVRDFTRPYANPDGIGGLSADAIASLDPAVVGAALQVAPDAALEQVTQASRRLSRSGSLATTTTTPARWKAPDATFQAGSHLAERFAVKLDTRLQAGAVDTVATTSLVGLAAGIAVSGVATRIDVATIARDLDARNAAVVAGLELTARPGGLVPGGRFGPRPVAAGRPGADLMLRAGAARGPAGAVRPPGPGAGVEIGTGATRQPGVGVGVGVGQPGAGIDVDAGITPAGRLLSVFVEQASTVTADQLRAEVQRALAAPAALALAPTPARPALAVTAGDLLQRLDPNRTVLDVTRSRIDVGALNFDPLVGELIRPIMAAPRFDRPMYQALDAYDREWLVPGLGTLPEPELVTLLASNDVFTESFLVGLSDEMGRELLWRNYPTDARGTYFHRFWDPERDELTQQIHRFRRTKLGSHLSVGPLDQSGRAVVVIRGELVRRYPDLTIMAMRQTGTDPEGRPLLPEAPTGLPDAAPSLFHAMLPPDVMLAGLDLGIDTLRQPGWWIVLAEHPQATRFRRSEPDLAGGEVRFAAPGGSAHGGAVAAARLEHPTRVAFAANDFLP